jgi:molybdate transport system ATP-binding protein
MAASPSAPNTPASGCLKHPNCPGSQRLRIAARDVSLALNVTGQLSIQNRLRATITAIDNYQHQQLVSLQLADGQRLLAEITPYASRSLQLEIGMQVTALVKGVALLE